MANASMGTGLQLRSTVKKDGIVELSLVSVATPEPKAEEVIVRIDAAPPSTPPTRDCCSPEPT
jgi:hypothetical protein